MRARRSLGYPGSGTPPPTPARNILLLLDMFVNFGTFWDMFGHFGIFLAEYYNV